MRILITSDQIIAWLTLGHYAVLSGIAIMIIEAKLSGGISLIILSFLLFNFVQNKITNFRDSMVWLAVAAAFQNLALTFWKDTFAVKSPLGFIFTIGIIAAILLLMDTLGIMLGILVAKKQNS